MKSLKITLWKVKIFLKTSTMKKIVYIDMDDVLCDFINAYNKAKKDNPKVEFPQGKYGFWLNLKPLENAVETVNYLKKYFDVYILSAPSEYNPLSYTEKRVWIENHLGFDMVNRLILSSHKNLNKGDYLIDDYTEGKGQELFEGQLINFGSDKFPDWNVVKLFFKEIVDSNKNNS